MSCTKIITIKRRQVHDLILLGIFLVLAITAIRNIPLFMIISLPVTAKSATEITTVFNRRIKPDLGNRMAKVTAIFLLSVMILLIPRILTDAYYINNLSYNKTGIGLDLQQQPEDVCIFLQTHHLDGRFINSLSYGGWLSWSLNRRVFIDARLEVIEESLYSEVVESWAGGLSNLIEKYKPDMLVYDYVRYFSWAPQLLKIPGWHPIYIDGHSVVFAREGYASGIGFPDTEMLINKFGLRSGWTVSDREKLLERHPPSSFRRCLCGFHSEVDHKTVQVRNMASFFLQMKQYALAEWLLLEVLVKSDCALTDCYYALADIYMQSGEFPLAVSCYKRILEDDPEKVNVRLLSNAEAAIHFNNGNQRYKSGDIMEALDEFTEVIRLNHGHAKAFLNRGYIKAVELERYQDAISDFDTAIMLDPSLPDAYLGRGSCRLGLHDLQGACKDWEIAKSLGNEKADNLLRQHRK